MEESKSRQGDPKLKLLSHQNTCLNKTQDARPILSYNKSKTELSKEGSNFSRKSSMTKGTFGSLQRPLQNSAILEPLGTRMRLMKDLSRNNQNNLLKKLGTRETLQKSYFNDILKEKSNKSFVKIRNLNLTHDKYIFEASKKEENSKGSHTPKRYPKLKKIRKFNKGKLKNFFKGNNKKYQRKIRKCVQNTQNSSAFQLSTNNRSQASHYPNLTNNSRLSPNKSTHKRDQRSISTLSKQGKSSLIPVSRTESPYKNRDQIKFFTSISGKI